MKEFIDSVVNSYNKTKSFKRTAADLKISTAKVRKALITAGKFTNDTVKQIKSIREAHPTWTDQQIAEQLHISLNAVQMYTPYILGPYDPDNRSESAERMAEYRERNRTNMDEIDGNRAEVGTIISAQKMIKEEEKVEEDPFDRPLDDPSWYDEQKQKAEAAGLPFPQFRHNPDAMPHVDDQFYLDYRLVEPAHYNDRHPTLKAMKLRLEVDTSEMSSAELAMIEKEYGVKKSWSRDLIIPSFIPLHFFHYVIQRAFGFENKADHLFQLTEEDFVLALEGAGGGMRSYCRLCGVLFRFPYLNDSELYWDDDYDGKKSVKTWLKEKYEGYWDTDAGTGYGYTDNQYRIWQWLGDRVEDFHKYVPAFDVTYDEFYEKLQELGAPEGYTIGEMDEKPVPGCGQFPFNNVLESLTLEEVLTMEEESVYFEDDLEMAESELLDNLITLEKARAVMEEAEEIYKLLEKRMKSGRWDEDVLLVKRWREKAKKAAQMFVMSRGGTRVLPFAEELIYLYDFGEKKGGFVANSTNPVSSVKSADGKDTAKWKIKIKLLDQFYDNSIYYGRNYTPSDATGARFQNDPEHEAEYADRLLAMCHWKEKLEVVDESDRWIVPADENKMMIELRPEQELLPEERERIETDRAYLEKIRLENGWEKERETVVDDDLYMALRAAMLEHRPVCIGKEGIEPGEGYPEKKIRNTSMEKLV